MESNREHLLVEINVMRHNNFKSELRQLRDTDLLRDDLMLDSLDLAELTVRLQARFGVDIFRRRNLRTVGDVLEELELGLGTAPDDLA